MKIVILGPGAIGSLWACCFSRAGHSVSLWSQRQYDSIYLQQEYFPEIQFTSNDKDKLTSADLLLVTLKAPNVLPVIEATSENYSSMHQDIFHNRPSEIDFITGYLLQRAKAHNIPAPVNQTLFQKIKQIEQDHD